MLFTLVMSYLYRAAEAPNILGYIRPAFAIFLLTFIDYRYLDIGLNLYEYGFTGG